MEKFKEISKKIGLLRFVIIVLCLISAIGLFLPYEASTDKHREHLKSYPNSYYIKEINLKNIDATDISVIENLQLYNYLMNNPNQMNNHKGNTWIQGEAVINFVLTIVLIASIVLILIFAIFKKYILSLICSILMAISSLAMNWDIVSRGVIPSDNYTFGISYYLFIIIAILIFAFSIVGIVSKKKNKK